jgi:hypothetical protein
MRLFAALAMVLVALMVATVRQAISKRGRSAAVAEPEAPPPGVEDGASPPARAPQLPYVAPAAGEASARGGVAHLHGRVLPAPGRGDDALGGTTTVSADDGVRSFDVEASSDGLFSLHLPPGRYDLIASSDEWTGAVSGVVAGAGMERAIDIQLAPGATISGVLRGDLDPVLASVIVWFAGRRSGEPSESAILQRGFEVTGLLPGRRYDLEISSYGARTVSLRDVTAPASDLAVELVPLPVLRGAFGFPGGGNCPIDRVEVALAERSHKDDDGEADDGGEVGSDCRFELTLPAVAVASPQLATVTATGSGWHVEQTITVPARGDPDPLCLNPPCRADQLN